ncbi:MAG: hypothetical protein GXY15_02805 [Candidatus Hydrogenedentes bacterium]|nr:hypothetical protein [Candidatus Hydrogenedentota bacterium]
MMRRSCVFFAAFAAAVMIAAGAPAATITVSEGEDLAQAIADAAEGDTIQLENTSGSEAVWPLDAPVTVTKDLEILGDPGLLPTESVIEGNGVGGPCPGNVVDNGDFEAGQTSLWIPNPPSPPVIVKDPARAASGEWLAQFTLDPCATPTPGLTPDQVELRYGVATPVPNLPPGGPARLEWMTLPLPFTVVPGATLTVWVKAHAPIAGNRLVVTVTDSGGNTGTAFIQDTDLAAAADWTPVALPLDTFTPAPALAAIIQSLAIESQFAVGAPEDPPCALIGGAEFGVGALALPTAAALNLGFALLSPGASLVELVAPFAGAAQVLSLGGLVPPALRFSVRADTPRPGDKIELLPRPGEAAVWSAAAESLAGANCQSVSVPLIPPSSVMPVFRATVQPPAAVSGPVTRFVLDDLSLSNLGGWLSALVKSGDKILYGDMENAGLAAGQWSAATPCDILGPPLPASYFTGPGCNASARALLLTREVGAPSAVDLRQSVTFPSSGSEIRFNLRVGQPGGADSTFKVEVDATVLLEQHAADASLASYRMFILPYPAAWRDTTKTLRFRAEIAGGAAPPSFLIDDVCIGLPPADPVLSVSNAHLRLENLTVSTGSAGVQATDDTAVLEFIRCATKNISGPGLRFSGKAAGTASNSVFTGCSGPAVLSDSTGLVTVYQCTAKGNGDGIRATSGPINLAASIIEDGNVTGEVNTWLNVIRGSFPPAPYEKAGFENLNPAPTVDYSDSPWTGKLQTGSPVLSGHFVEVDDPVTGLVASADRAFDFEGDARGAVLNEELQVGADQEGGGLSGTPIWISCSVDPPVVGRGEPVTITVVTQGINLNDAKLRMVPEEPLPGMTVAADPTILRQCYEVDLVPTGENTATATVTFSEPCNFRSADDTALCTEGINLVYLNDYTGAEPNPTLYGHGFGITDTAGDCSFLVDTTPPTLLFSASADGDAATAQPRAYGNDSLVGTGVPGPQGAHAIPVSGGTIVDRALHFLFNPGGNGTCADTAAGDTLSFGIEAVFEDRPPAPLTHVTTSGFESDTGTDFTEQGDGRAWLEGPLGPTDSGTTTVTLSTDPAAAVKRLTARFEAVTSQSVPDPWRFEGKPAARDRAGNEITAPNPLVLWWMWRAQAEITNGPRDTQTLSPRFDWKLRRNIKGPDAADVAPIVPYVKAKLWRGADAAADREISTMQWVPVTGWSGWISGPITPETDMGGSPLSVLLQANQNDPDPTVSRTLMLTVVGADEAGNIQPAGLADSAAVTVADLTASCISYTWWYNGQSQENVSVDTEARVTLSEWRRNTANNTDSETRPYGSVTRVPLPPKGVPPLYDYLKLRAALTARLPETIRRAVINGETNVAQAWIKWTLYEDGNPVANNTAVVGPGVDFVDIILPVSPATPTGLVFGDMKDRKREKRYVLTAQTVLKTYSYSPDGTAFPARVISDPTPASVSFTVYPKEVDDNLRDERPTRIYERE